MTSSLKEFLRLLSRFFHHFSLIRSYKDLTSLVTIVKTYALHQIRMYLERKKFYKNSQNDILIQNKYDVSNFRTARKVILFLVPVDFKLSFETMSIFYFCRFSRHIEPDALTLISTFPGFLTCAKYDTFPNSEQIYRFEQIIDNYNYIHDFVLHVPEYYSSRLFRDLKREEIKALKSIANFHINILNQNIESMPDCNEFADLFNLTENITHTAVNNRYVSKQVCDYFRIPLHYVPSFTDLDNCVNTIYEEKEKLILYSTDTHPMKSKILTSIQDNLLGFRLKQIDNSSLDLFLDDISKALFCITFSGVCSPYYIQPFFAGSIGICVYNDTHYPSSMMRAFPFVYESYEQLCECIVKDIYEIYQSKDKYERVSRNILDFLKKYINHEEDTITGLKRLYGRRPIFIPTNGLSSAVINKV